MSFRLKIVSFIGVIYFFSFYALYNLDDVMANGDSSGYYIHLVSAFIYNDVGDYSKSTEAMVENFPSSKALLDDPFWLRETAVGRKSIKYTIGVAVMEFPAFILAHIYTKWDKKYASDGWSKPYILAINISKVLYILLGLFFLIPVLLNYFSRSTTALSILGIALGTNLFFHVPNLTMAHPFQFFNMCMLIYFSSKFYDRPNYLKATMIGVFVGLITITRIPEIIAISIPIFWGVYNVKTLKERTRFFLKNYNYLITALAFLAIIIIPQFFYWHYVSGQFFFNSYEGEGFDFTSPDFFRAFFSYNNGWLVYTPLMFFSLVGMFFLRKKAPSAILPILLFVGMNSWIHFSYYIVNYLPGLGSRVMIESYPLLVFGLAAFFSYCSRNRILKVISIVILTASVILNVFQTIQSNKGILLSEQMNRTYFREIFGRLKIDINSVKEFDSNENQPNDNDIQLSENLHFEDFENGIVNNISNDFSHSGQSSYLSTNEFPKIKFEATFKDLDLNPSNYICSSIFAYRKKEDAVTIQWDLERLDVEFFNEIGKRVKHRGIRITRYIGNDNNSIFHTGKTDVWGEASFCVEIPKKSNPNWKVKVLVLNPSNNILYLDDFSVDRYVDKR